MVENHRNQETGRLKYAARNICTNLRLPKQYYFRSELLGNLSQWHVDVNNHYTRHINDK